MNIHAKRGNVLSYLSDKKKSRGLFYLGNQRKCLLNDWRLRLEKRMVDLILSCCVLILSPLWVIPIGIAIRLSSPGPIFFRQLRTGKNGKEFWIYKFRSMEVNILADIQQAVEEDTRVTSVGRFLRHTSLDELPQFYNVLRGEMSVVGPRPHMLQHTDYYSRHINNYMARHLIKPGITGWAQINGLRGATPRHELMQQRVSYDLWYLDNWSLWLDFCIIARSILVFFPKRKIAVCLFDETH